MLSELDPTSVFVGWEEGNPIHTIKTTTLLVIFFFPLVSFCSIFFLSFPLPPPTLFFFFFLNIIPLSFCSLGSPWIYMPTTPPFFCSCYRLTDQKPPTLLNFFLLNHNIAL